MKHKTHLIFIRVKSTVLVFFLWHSIICAQSSKDTPSIIEESLSAVVTVAVYKADYTKTMLGMRGNAIDAYAKHLDLANAESSGSGFVIKYKEKLYVVTNAHVVEAASQDKNSLFVYSITRNKYEVRVKGGDTFYDFAILEFITPPGKEFSTLSFSIDEPRIGEPVYAIGNPLGEYPYTVSDGIISARNRARGGITGKFGFLQSTATVIWGNSGGPLINSSGKVVGINSQIAFADDGRDGLWQPQINFALEASICRRLMNDVFEFNGVIQRAFLGIEASQNSRLIQNPYSGDMTLQLIDPLPIISGILPNSPAASVISEDWIGATVKRVNGEEVRNLNELLGEFEKIKPGSPVTVLLEKSNVVKEASINAILLKTGHNESIAQQVFKKDPYLSSLNVEDLSFTIPKSQTVPRKYKNTIAESAQGFSGKLIALGQVHQNQSSMWKTDSFSNIGAVLRMFGQTGYCQLALQLNGYGKENTQLYPVYFSNSDNEVKAVIWY